MKHIIPVVPHSCLDASQKDTHKHYLSISQFVFINSKKRLYRVNDSQLVLIIFIQYWFIHSPFSSVGSLCQPRCVTVIVQWRDGSSRHAQQYHNRDYVIHATSLSWRVRVEGSAAYGTNQQSPSLPPKNITKTRGSFPVSPRINSFFLLVLLQKILFEQIHLYIIRLGCL